MEVLSNKIFFQCNDKKISRHHAELIFKNGETLWIKPTHTNPVFYRGSNGKTVQLTKDIEQELKHADQIGLLPTTYFFRIHFSNNANNSNIKEQSSKSSDQQANAEVKTATASSKYSSDIQNNGACVNDRVSLYDITDDRALSI